MTNEEAIQVMCRRCSSHDVCKGTGCEPRLTLAKLIADYNDYCNELRKEWEAKLP